MKSSGYNSRLLAADKPLGRYIEDDVAKDGNSVAKRPIFENQRLLNYDDLSVWIGVPVSTVQKWVHRNDIPYLKAGRHVRFEAEEVRRWLRDNGGTTNGF